MKLICTDDEHYFGLVSEMRFRLAIFDLAGTLIDHGSLSPTRCLIKSFKKLGVDVPKTCIDEYMGYKKIDHIRKILDNNSVRVQWRGAHGRYANIFDVMKISELYQKEQLEDFKTDCKLINGAIDTLYCIKTKGMKIGITTGYTREMVDSIFHHNPVLKSIIDISVAPDEVPNGRPYPDMINRIHEKLLIPAGRHTIKIGDSIADIEEGVRAGCTSVGVSMSSHIVGLTENQLKQLSRQEYDLIRYRVENQMYGHGAHAVVDTVSSIPGLINRGVL